MARACGHTEICHPLRRKFSLVNHPTYEPRSGDQSASARKSINSNVFYFTVPVPKCLFSSSYSTLISKSKRKRNWCLPLVVAWLQVALSLFRVFKVPKKIKFDQSAETGAELPLWTADTTLCQRMKLRALALVYGRHPFICSGYIRDVFHLIAVIYKYSSCWPAKPVLQCPTREPRVLLTKKDLF